MDQEIENLYNLANSKLKIQLCFILGSEEHSLNEIHQTFEREYSYKKNKETIYRALESLLKSNLVEKRYDMSDKVLKYSLRISKVEVDFINKHISFS